MWPDVPEVEGGIVIEIVDSAVVYHISLYQERNNFEWLFLWPSSYIDISELCELLQWEVVQVMRARRAQQSLLL